MNLNTEQQAFLDHQLLPSNKQELILRRDALRNQMIDDGNCFGQNRTPALLAIAELGKLIDSPESKAQRLNDKRSAGAVAAAQRFYDQGETVAAEQLLKHAGLDMSVLKARPQLQQEALDKKTHTAVQDYNFRKQQAIADLTKRRMLSPDQAEIEFEKHLASDTLRQAKLGAGLSPAVHIETPQ